MPVTAVLYAADLSDLERFVGCGDEMRFREARAVLDDEEADWEPEERAVLERLLRRMVFDGALYAGLEPLDRYYLTQLLVDLFDEFAAPDALTEDLGHEALMRALESVPAGTPARRGLSWLARGRELGGTGPLWTTGPIEDCLALMGYVRRTEADEFARSLGEAIERIRSRPPRGGARSSGVLAAVRNAAAECARAELDLVSLVS